MTAFRTPTPTYQAQARVTHVHDTSQPQDDPNVHAISDILLAGGSILVIVAALVALLKPLRIRRVAIMAAVGLAMHDRSSAHTPNARLKVNGLDPKSPAAAVARSQRVQELHYRAAYLLAAAKRIQAQLNEGSSVREAVQKEAPIYKRHEAARKNRLDSAAKVAKASDLFGDELGWYRNPDSHSETECLAADGNNFSSSQGTIIGWPGSVHPQCACEAGPPHEDGGSVNDAVRGVISIGQGKVRPKRAALAS